MESTCQIFSGRQIDGCLSANTGVYCCQKCGGDLYESDATQKDCGAKTRKIPYNAAAEGYNEIRSCQLIFS